MPPVWGGNTGTGSDEAVQAGLDAYRQGQRGSDPTKIPGYENMDAWRQWYSQQQGGKRPEDMARFSDQTLAGWDPFLVKEGQYAGKYRSMRGAEGYYDKPTECPPGMMPSGPNEDDPCVPNGQAGGAGGGGGGGGGGGRGPGGGGRSAWDNPIYQYLKGKAMDQNGWVDTWLGQGGASQYQQEIDAARQQAESLPPGPARDAALARISQMGVGTLRQGAEQARMGMLSGQLMPQEFGYTQLGENARQANQQNALGWGNLNLNRDLGFSQLSENQRQWDQGLGFRRWETEGGWGMQGQQNALSQPTGLQKGLGIASAGVGLAKGAYDLWKDWKNQNQGGQP